MMTLFSKNKYLVLSVMVWLPPILWGCSYRFSGTGALPSGITSIYVTVIQNNTAEAGIEKYITDDLINEFILRRKEALSRQESAEGILSGSIEFIRDSPIAHSSQSKSIQRRVVMGIDLKLTDQKGSVIWAVNGINANQAYRVTDDKTQTDQNKKAAIRILSKRLAEKTYNRLTDDF